MLSPSFIVNYNCVYFSLMLSDGIVKINFLKTAKESLSIVAEREVSMFFIEARRIAIVILSSLLLAVSLNFFLINANVYASGFTGAAQLVSRDRKSTRLNSSHVAISYAVFFLKKKNITQ